YIVYVPGGGGSPAIDRAAPKLTEIKVAADKNMATITWKTDEASTSLVKYGLTSVYGIKEFTDLTKKVTSHTIALKDLSPETTYHYQVLSYDDFGNLAQSTDLTFKTLSKETALPPTTVIPTEEEKKVEEIKKPEEIKKEEEAKKKEAEKTKTLTEEFKKLTEIGESKQLEYEATKTKASENALISALSIIKQVANNVSLGALESNAKDLMDLFKELVPNPVLEGMPAVEISGNEVTIKWITDKQSNS
ncbi:MAG: hypothetical protein COX43_01860, partial [Parcubacteria group bacterium CG23_combo_of_CG06-09_8_20_14_all_35_9]